MRFEKIFVRRHACVLIYQPPERIFAIPHIVLMCLKLTLYRICLIYIYYILFVESRMCGYLIEIIAPLFISLQNRNRFNQLDTKFLDWIRSKLIKIVSFLLNNYNFSDFFFNFLLYNTIFSSFFIKKTATLCVSLNIFSFKHVLII